MIWMLIAWAMATLVLVVVALMTKRDDRAVKPQPIRDLPSAPARPLPFVRGYRRRDHFPNRFTIKESDLKR